MYVREYDYNFSPSLTFGRSSSSSFKDFEPHRAEYRATGTRINPITGIKEPVRQMKTAWNGR
jgi:hypothetical protein